MSVYIAPLRHETVQNTYMTCSPNLLASLDSRLHCHGFEESRNNMSKCRCAHDRGRQVAWATLA